jgi:uncharacterized membrane protein
MTDPSSQWPEPTGYPPARPQRQMMPLHPAMRAATVDRERAVDVLKAGFAEGRLSQDEYNDRMGRAYTARTYGELAALTSDLPAGPIPLITPPPWQAQGQAWAPSSATRTNGTAIAAMLLGFASIAMGVTAIPAIICGHIARGQIKRTGEQGEGMAMTGLVLGYLVVVFGVLLVLFVTVAETRSGTSIHIGPGAPNVPPGP